jgi:glycosyltransferase involved in cell wall biosynthesis
MTGPIPTSAPHGMAESDPHSRRLRVLLLTPIPRRVAPQDYTPGMRPDPFDQWQQLAHYGVDVDMVDPTPRPLNPMAGRHSFYQSIDPYRALKTLFLRRNYDLVIVGQDGGAAILVMLRRLARFKPPILIWDLSPAARWPLRQRIQDFILPRIDGILAVHSGQAPYIAKRWGSHIPVSVVGYSIDTNFWHPRHNEPPEHILSVGDDPGRDYPTLVAAMQGVVSDLIIRTRQTVPVDAAATTSIRLAADRLDFVAYRGLFARSRFIVLPLKPHTLNASGITTLAEASAMGKPVIITDSDGVRDFLQPGENCLTVPAGDPDTLRAAMQRLLREPETCERLGRNARRYAEEHYARGAFARHFAEILRDHARLEPRLQIANPPHA